MDVTDSSSGTQAGLGWAAVGLACGIASTGLSAIWTTQLALAYNAILLGAIAWVYIGFAIAEGRSASIAVQLAAAAAFLVMAFVGYREDSRAVLGIGFLLHAGWDWLHHDYRGPPLVSAPLCGRRRRDRHPSLDPVGLTLKRGLAVPGCTKTRRGSSACAFVSPLRLGTAGWHPGMPALVEHLLGDLQRPVPLAIDDP